MPQIAPTDTRQSTRFLPAPGQYVAKKKTTQTLSIFQCQFIKLAFYFYAICKFKKPKLNSLFLCSVASLQEIFGLKLNFILYLQ